MNNKKLTFYFFLLAIVTVFFSCGGNNKKDKEADKPYNLAEQAYTDSINKIRREEKRIENDKRNGRFRAIDTIYFGSLHIYIDSIAIKDELSQLNASSGRKSIDRLMGGAYRGYDVYVSMKNTSPTQTLTIPYVFPEKTKEEIRMSGNDTGTMLLLGTRMFINSKTKKLVKNYDILPGKEIYGYYHVTSRSIKAITISYGSQDYSDEDDDTPTGYEDTEVYVDLTSKLPDKKPAQ